MKQFGNRRRTRKTFGAKSAGARRGQEKGFSLVEVAVALGIMGMLMLSVAQLFMLANYMTRYVEETTRLTNIAELQIENLRLRNLNSGLNLAPELTLNVASTPPQAADLQKLPNPDFFKDMLVDRHALVVTWGDTADKETASKATVWSAKTVNPVWYDAAKPGDVARLQAIVDTKGTSEPVMAWVYWWARPVFGGQAIEVQIHVDSGYLNLLGAASYPNMPFLNKASVRRTVFLPGKQFFNIL